MNLGVRRRVKSIGRRIKSLQRLKVLAGPLLITATLVIEGALIGMFWLLAIPLVPLSVALVFSYSKVVGLTARLEELKRSRDLLIGLQKDLDDLKDEAGIE